jgi:ABC-2 type transport system permease protein
VYFRDIVHLYGVLTMAWMYVTPIFYPVSALPDDVAGLLNLNPMYHFISFFRELVLYAAVPSAQVWISCIVSSLAVFSAGVVVFYKMQRNFILHV